MALRMPTGAFRFPQRDGWIRLRFERLEIQRKLPTADCADQPDFVFKELKLTILLSVVAERNPEDFIFEGGKVYRPRDLGVPTGSEDS